MNVTAYYAVGVPAGLLVMALDDSAYIGDQIVWLVVREVRSGETGEVLSRAPLARTATETDATALVSALNT